jgi:hypothetical protein
MNVHLVGVDACAKEGLIMVWQQQQQQQQQRFRYLLLVSLSLVADAAACCLHVSMANGQWCGCFCSGAVVSASLYR